MHHRDGVDVEALHWQLAQLGRDLRRDLQRQRVFELTAAAAVDLVPGAEEAGICLLRARRRVSPVVHTGAAAECFDALQAEEAQGPCLDAVLGGGTVVVVDDLAAESERWPSLAPRARETGAASALCVQLCDSDTTFGALKVVSTRVGAFTDASVQVGRLLATHAAFAAVEARAVENLQRGLQQRDVIGQAKGILMERHRVTPDQAFAALARASQNSNRKLHDVAADLAATGELPAR